MSFDIIIDWQEYKTDFRGHEVTMLLRPLKTWASIMLTPLVRRSQEKAASMEKEIRSIARANNINIDKKIDNYIKKHKVGRSLALTKIINFDPDFKKIIIDSKVPSEDEINYAYDLQAVSKKVFPDHVKDIVGITINKKPITIEILCDETAFGPLCMDIVGELVKRSRLIEDEAKNLDGPSGMQTKTEESIPVP